ncbi:PREDICTED: uncharacterized protein C5orf49 homolog [Galeopterus variegatus]|uniref:Uncharacterized protein C5orf49 homolog n=1 Tax=Galeopterus variegatus TaxID=482537 RepID=A0ABM0RHD1_GALVR|nr:PREDICTED: uncharacterized protein C5orf49 homolog [Galeopterus variegatus]
MAAVGTLDGSDDVEDEEEITAAALRAKPRPLPIWALSAFSHQPPHRLDLPLENSRPAEPGIISLYDCVFKKNLDYNQKLHRDDREHAKSLGLRINEEEQERPVGVLTSSVYGKRVNQPLEPLNRDYRRANHVKADFYRKNDIPSIKEPGFGHIAPA